MYRLKKSIKRILATGSCSSKAWATVVLYGCSFDNFVTFRADVFTTLVSRASRLSGFRGEVSSLAWIAANFSSVSTVHSSLASCLAALLLFSAYWPLCFMFASLELVVLETGADIFCDIFKHTHVWNTVTLKTDDVQECTWLDACCYITEWLINALPATSAMIHSARLLSPTAKAAHPSRSTARIFDSRVFGPHVSHVIQVTRC